MIESEKQKFKTGDLDFNLIYKRIFAERGSFGADYLRNLKTEVSIKSFY